MYHIIYVMTTPWVSQHCSNSHICNKLYCKMCWSKHCC